MSDLKFKPAGNRVLVQLLEQPAQVGSLHLPDNVRETRPAEGVIAGIGGRVPDTFEGRVGDRVYTDRFQGELVKIAGKPYRLHAPSEILAVIDHVQPS